jgi:hypothetical protein
MKILAKHRRFKFILKNKFATDNGKFAITVTGCLLFVGSSSLKALQFHSCAQEEETYAFEIHRNYHFTSLPKLRGHEQTLTQPQRGWKTAQSPSQTQDQHVRATAVLSSSTGLPLAFPADSSEAFFGWGSLLVEGHTFL